NDLEKAPIVVGQTLVILPVSGVSYTIQKGDSLQSIAKKLKGDPDDIAYFNGIDPSAPLNVGDQIVVSDGEETPPPAPATPSAPSTVGARGLFGTDTGVVKNAPKVRLGIALPDDSYFAWPVAGGVRTQGLHGHNGVDIGAPTGTSILAAAAGKVIFARDDDGWNGGYGNYVVISHPNGTQTLYAHMSKVLVSTGDTVSKKETIVLVGETGKATGPHLHFEVRGGRNPFGY
ncbi:MAG TPA: LysM peptidoglycan-binding domain-containing M23 family metallopeptidase, partial [Nitrososphaera sp.]|nr:LysM peptidoglycan-binding domain-containing M23 family metallopeptidase [Nitrososphaera sp.]